MRISDFYHLNDFLYGKYRGGRQFQRFKKSSLWVLILSLPVIIVVVVVVGVVAVVVAVPVIGALLLYWLKDLILIH